MSYFFFLYWSPSSSLCMVFDSISFNIDEVLSINPSATLLIFGEFNVHHKDWFTYSGGTDRSGDRSQTTLLRWLVNFPTRIPDCDSQSPALLDLFFSSDASILLVLQRLSLYWKILIILLSQFPLTFHHIHYGMPHFIA